MGLAREEVQGAYDEVAAVLADVENSDKSSEKLSKKGCFTAFFSLFIFVGIGVAAENLDDTMLKFGLGFGIFLFLLGLVIYAWGKGGDVEDSRYQADSVLDVVKIQVRLPKRLRPVAYAQV